MKNNTKKLAIGGIIAAAAGYIAGILTAPKSGKETREDIHDTAINAKTEAEKQLKLLHSELDILTKKGITQASKLTSDARKELNDALQKAGIAKDKAKAILSAVHEGGSDNKELEKAVKEATKAITHIKKYLAN